MTFGKLELIERAQVQKQSVFTWSPHFGAPSIGCTEKARGLPAAFNKGQLGDAGVGFEGRTRREEESPLPRPKAANQYRRAKRGLF